MPKVAQHLLLALGIFALIVLGTEIGLSVAATQHGSTPAKVDTVQAGPYSLKLSLYTDPAHAGFALPFAIVPLLLFTRRRDVMGALVNHRLTTALGTIVVAIVVTLNVFLLVQTFGGGL